jgi:two-component system KDP operon response regulator KdpE
MASTKGADRELNGSGLQGWRDGGPRIALTLRRARLEGGTSSMTDAMYLILVIADDPTIRSVLRPLFEGKNYLVAEVDRGACGVIEARSGRPDLVILDLGLPDRDGQSVIREIRSFSQVPILVRSARTKERDKIAALDGGADDYVVKPFNVPELLARVRVAFRRAARIGSNSPILHFGPITVDLATRAVVGSNRSVHLTPLEFRLIECLAHSSGRIVAHNQLISEVWGPDQIDDTRGLRSYIKQIRQKIEPDPRQPRFLKTVSGVGYWLNVDDVDLPAVPGATPSSLSAAN